ncbi:hypothetical protein G6F65_018161 [Rhizopus arrhizus]|nr:hypothetical protein G6F65_018161 [Rhizopus arrhizus]
MGCAMMMGVAQRAGGLREGFAGGSQREDRRDGRHRRAAAHRTQEAAAQRILREKGAHHRLFDGGIRGGLPGGFVFSLRGVAAATAGKAGVGVERIAE